MPASFTLYGNPGSSSSNRVRIMLAEAGFADYDFVSLDFKTAEQKTLEHLRRHPWGKIPAITTGDGFTLYESRAICKFLAAKYNFPLLLSPSDLVARAVFDQAESAEASYFSPSAGAISFEKFAKPLIGLTTDQAVVACERKKLQEYFDIIDEILTRQGYLAGNDYSLVDIYHIPVVERLFACGDGDLIRERGNVNAWWQRCLIRPAVKKYMDEMPSFEDIKKKLAASNN